MKEFKANDKTYELNPQLRDELKPQWQEIFKPAKETGVFTNIYAFMPFITKTETQLQKHGLSLVGKDILEAGCCYGERSYLLSKYEGTRVHGIDIDEYLVNQAIDLNTWNPKDIEFIHDKISKAREQYANGVPEECRKKVSFSTCGMEGYATPNKHDVIISWDVLEHIQDLRLAFRQMANSVKAGGFIYHEYNPFFAVSGGHSLCTLDFYFGHCRLSPEDFERYIADFRPNELKTAMNFYKKCLNRETRENVRKYAVESGFEILEFEGESCYTAPIEDLKRIFQEDMLPDVKLHYPNVTIDDLLYDSVHLIARKND